MICRMHTPVFEDAVRLFFGGDGLPSDMGAAPADDRLATIHLPKRKIDPVMSRRLLMALLEQRVLRVRYMSLNSGSDDWREIVPGGLAWDGHRWHVRAWCQKSGEWRDFVLGRMVSADWPTEYADELPEDVDWTTFDVIKVKINPKLNAERREALRIDYNLPGEYLEIRVRRAMKPYLLAAMYIDHKSHRDLPRHFVLAE
jgi:predicted DNA-binding transcriptional regulator YafY